MLHCRPKFRGHVQLEDNGGDTILQAKIAGAGTVSGMQDRTDSQVYGGAPPDPSWLGAGQSVEGCPVTNSDLADIPGLLHKSGRVIVITIKGIQGGEGGQWVEPTSRYTAYTATCRIL